MAHEPSLKVFLFGSRASGRASSRSDIDVGIDAGHPMDSVAIWKLRDALDALPVFQRADVVDFGSADPGFKEIALREIEVIYERPARKTA